VSIHEALALGTLQQGFSAFDIGHVAGAVTEIEFDQIAM
jgi:hypothetical protein